MKRIAVSLLSILFVVNLASAEETSFQRIKVPNLKGKQTDGVLTFSDDHKSIEVRPVKGDATTIPYSQIDRFSYEYTRKHRIKQGAIIMAAGVAPGGIVMLTRSRSHWLEIDYYDADIPKAFVVRMDKRDYLHILDAVKQHTGKDAEVLGNANKRQK